MAKVAICISGQPREATRCFPFIYENIIKPNNADVFMHMNFDKQNTYIEKSHKDNGVCYVNSNIDEELIKLYNPKRILVEKPKNFQNKDFKIPPARLERLKIMNHKVVWTHEECINYIIKQQYSMFYSIYKCNELKEIYALENNIRYDYVIRIRYDLLPRNKIQCSLLNPNMLYYVNLQQPDNLISDWINIGSNAIMNTYSSLFLNLEYINTLQFLKKNDRLENTLEPSDECGGMSEHSIRDWIYHLKIPVQSFNSHIELA